MSVFEQPNYEDIINAMPEVIDFRGSAAERRARAASARRAALQSLVVRYGGLGSLTDTYGDVDEATRAAAAGNQFSDLARLQRSYDEGVEGVKRNLAARRMLQSGELQYGLDKADVARGTSEYDLGQRFLNAAGQVVGGFTDVEAALAAEEAGVINSAAQNAGLNYSVPTPPAQPPANTGGGGGGQAGSFSGAPGSYPAMTGPTTTRESGTPAYYRVVEGALKGLGYA